MSNPLHDKGEHYITTPKAEPLLERLIFNNRPIILIIFALLTAFFGYHAVQIKPDASFERLIPLEHPYIKNMMEHRADLQNLGNSIRIAVAVKDGDIFTEEYMDLLEKVTDEVFFLNGVDRAGVQSIWTPNTRWVEVTEEGFQGGTVIPGGDGWDKQRLASLEQNIQRSGEIGRLVADDFKSTIISAPLLEKNPETGETLNYQAFGNSIEEKIREKYAADNPNVEIHVVGFAKKVGDLINGIQSIGLFFLVTIGLTFVLLLLYSRCWSGTLTPIFASIIAVFWQLGILKLLGFGLDPYSVLVPFLVFAVGISHGVQIVNAMAVESADGHNAYESAKRAFRGLYVPGMIALLSDAIGFLTLLFIEIDVIRDLAVSASIGVAVVIVTNLVLHPVLLSYVGISKSGVRYVQNHDERHDRKWHWMSKFAHPSVAPVSILIALIGTGLGFYLKQDLKVGDLDPGAPELRADSRYNMDNKFMIENYSTSSDVLVVMVKTEPERCSSYPVMAAMNELQWRLENTPGVESTASIVTVSKIVTKAFNEGNFKWSELSRNQQVINSSVQRAPSGLINSDCSLTPVLAFLEDHKAETLQRVVDVVEDYVAENPQDDFQFLLAAGNAGVDAATNEVISDAKNMMLAFVYAVVSILCYITFRSIRAVLCIVIPLGLTSVLCEALMAQLGIGIKVETLPVIALGVGIGVDYGIYIYAKFEHFLLQGRSLQNAYFETLRSTGKAVIFTGITLGIGVCTWILSPIKFQANMGLLLFFMFIWNMVGAIWLLPALARFLLRPDQMVARAKAAQVAG
ncbi:efflux RND transporter permease subunit [Allohahella sp. A8]|uniref:efflux RND transporter permease subunit n=1 Tax=Allohahella sp. A8 TaxID=3141461 RepID=UPI003A80B006